MNHLDARYLLPLLGVLAAVWLALALSVLLTRVGQNTAAALLRRLHAIVLRGEEPSVRLPRRLLERAVADPSTPAPVAKLFTARLLEHHGAQLVREARGETGRRWRRVRALTVLTRARSANAVPLLAEALESGDEELVAAVVPLLGELGELDSSAVLVRALRTNAFARSRVAAQLDESSRPIPQLLLPLLGDGDSQVRYWGVALLARYAGAEAIERELVRSATDPDPSVRAAAVEGLARRRTQAAGLTAAALLEDPVWFVRAHAARALRDLNGGNGPAVASLLADRSWWVRAAAKETLEARPGLALELLLAYLDHEDEFARNGAAEVLQNTGVLDALLGEASGSVPETAQRILAAGSRRLAGTAAARNGLDREHLEQLAATRP